MAFSAPSWLADEEINELDWAIALNSINSLIVNYAIVLLVCPIISRFICQISAVKVE
jgi:hypothetical protein